VEPLTSKRRASLQRRFHALATDETATAAAGHLRRGVTLGDLPDSTGATAQAALLRYYMTIERIAQAVTSATRRERKGAIDRERERIASELSEVLGTLPPPKQVAAIEEAGRSLRRAELRYAEIEVREAARTLGLADAIADSAAKFAGFRGKYLGHSSQAPNDQVMQWLAGPENRAFGLATAYLAGYLDRLPLPG